MRYLPALLLIGLAAAAIIGITMKSTKKNAIGLGVCFVIYVFSEITFNLQSSYLLGMTILVVGTLAIGGMIGFLIGLIVSKIRQF